MNIRHPLIFHGVSHAADLQGDKPRWEAGFAIGAASLPQYMGSDERYLLAAPIPYLIYRGDRLKIDRSGIRQELFGIRDLSIDLSLGIGMPVRNSNVARSGMPELKFSFQVGPRLNWQIFSSDRSSLQLWGWPGASGPLKRKLLLINR